MFCKKLFTALFAVCLFSFAARAQMITVRGTVSDDLGPVIGAAVISGGGTLGTLTDNEGKFTLSVDSDAVLEVSCIGYKSEKVNVAGRQVIAITLQTENDVLDDAVVVGYGTQKKTNLTGAVSVVKSDALKDRSALDVGHMLQGTVPGLNVTSASGRPGQGTTLNIRGLNSINGGNPLVLVDGVEGDLQRINPNDVETISVIKDAAASAIYGARASFGVILVTTKNGNESDGKATVSYSGRVGFTTPTTSTDYETRGYWSVYTNNLFFKTYSGSNYAEYTEADMNELWIRRNDKTEVPERPWVTVETRNGKNVYNYYANTDWYHYLYKDVKPTTSHNITLSGGAGKFKYLLSGNYNSEQGVFAQNPDKYRRFNLRAKLSMDVTKWLSVSNNTSFFLSKYSYPGISGVNNAFGNSTVHALASYPVTNPDGTSVYTTQYNGYTVMDGFNMAVQDPNFRNVDDNHNFSTTFEVKIKPIKQLEIVGNYTYTYNNSTTANRSVNSTYSQYPGVLTTITTGKFENKLAEAYKTNTYQSANVFATYTDTFADSHNLKVMAGFNYEQKHLKDIGATGYNLMADELMDLDLVGPDAEGERKTDVSGGQNEYAIAGFFGRINYDYKGKYLLEVSGRFDGTSRFKSENRWGFFPSASVGWRISEENFFAPAKQVLNDLKIRYSFGRLGNQQVGYYDYLRTVSIDKQSYLFGSSEPAAATMSAPVASNLTWETIQQHNIGLDMAFLNNRLVFSGEAYIRDTKDMLTEGMALPAVYGADSPKMNSADLRTKGIELSLSWRDRVMIGRHPLDYSISAVFSDYTSKITKYKNNPNKLLSDYYEGMTYGEIWGYHIDGLFPDDITAKNYDVDQSLVNEIINSSAGEENGLRAGDLKYADLDGSKAIGVGENTVDDPGDRRVIGNSQPRFNYGVNLGVNFFGFDLSVFIQGIGKMDWYPSADARAFWSVYARPYMTFIPRDFLDDCWSEDNPNAYFPRPRGYVAMSTSRELGAVNDKYLQNIGYCRLKNLTFGYTIPAKVLEKAKISQLRVYFTGENLAYLSSLHSKYIDPELAQQSGKLYTYPWQRTFMFGIDITF